MLKVGVDCEKIARFRKLPYAKNERFYRKIFTELEIQYCISCRDPYPRFAVRFAAKEAAFKALNSVARINYTDIEVRKGKRDEPNIRINRNRFKGIKRFTISLSLTHSDSYAVAFVAVNYNKKVIKETRRALRKSKFYIKKEISEKVQKWEKSPIKKLKSRLYRLNIR